MYQTYAGKVLNGQPVILERVILPEKAKLFITVVAVEEVGEITEQIKTVDEAELAKRREMLKSITGIIKTDVDVKALRAERINKRGLVE